MERLRKQEGKGKEREEKRSEEKDLWLPKGKKGKEDKEEKEEGSKQEMEEKDRENKMTIGLNKGTKIILEEKLKDKR